jgi:hypothetical protein
MLFVPLTFILSLPPVIFVAAKVAENETAPQNIEVSHTACIASDKLPTEVVESGEFRELRDATPKKPRLPHVSPG